MIYLQAVEYSLAEQEFVVLFDSREQKVSSFWGDAECKPITSRIKKHYKSAQRRTCCYCRQIIPVGHGRAWDVEHIVPRNSHPAFMFTPRNLALACPDCNGSKSKKQTLVNPAITNYPSHGEAFLIIHPHFDSYQAHIEHGNYAYVGLTDKGKWTIGACNLTRFAGVEFGWPDPIADERFEEQVANLMDGDGNAANVIDTDLRAAI